MVVEEFLQGDLGTSPRLGKNNETRSGTWGTMFSQLARRSTRMLISGIFKKLGTFVVVPDVLSKFSKIGNVFFF